jgi:plastocyanin
VCAGLALGARAAGAGTVTGAVKLSGASEAERTVVYIQSVPEGSFNAAAASAVRLSQRGATFRPAVLPVVRGARVDLTNDDWVAHNVFSKSQAKSFDLGLYAQEDKKIVIFDQSGVVPVFCSIHPRMSGVILVLQNPFFAKPDREGHFALDGVPEGTWDLKVFRPGAPERAVKVKVPASGSVEARF